MCKKYACKKTSCSWFYYLVSLFMSISLFTFQQLCCLIAFYSESAVEEQFRLELRRVTKSTNKKWHSERKQRFKTKDILYTVVEDHVTGHALPMWVCYSHTQRAALDLSCESRNHSYRKEAQAYTSKIHVQRYSGWPVLSTEV